MLKDEIIKIKNTFLLKKYCKGDYLIWKKLCWKLKHDLD